MSGTTEYILPEDEDIEASKKPLTSTNENQGCLIDAKPPENIKHLIAKDEGTTTK